MTKQIRGCRCRTTSEYMFIAATEEEWKESDGHWNSLFYGSDADYKKAKSFFRENMIFTSHKDRSECLEQCKIKLASNG